MANELIRDAQHEGFIEDMLEVEALMQRLAQEGGKVPSEYLD